MRGGTASRAVRPAHQRVACTRRRRAGSAVDLDGLTSTNVAVEALVKVIAKDKVKSPELGLVNRAPRHAWSREIGEGTASGSGPVRHAAGCCVLNSGFTP